MECFLACSCTNETRLRRKLDSSLFPGWGRDRTTLQSQQQHNVVCSLPTPCSMLATAGKLFSAQGTCQDLYFSRCPDLSPCIQRIATRVKMSPAPQQRSQSDFDCDSCKQDLGQTGARSDASSWGFNTGLQTLPAKLRL